MDAELTDFLIIGSGVAGLRAAIELAPYGKVIVVTKDLPRESSTEYAQGGIAAALSDEDQVGIHYEDTIRAGDGLCKEEAVNILVNEGPARILELIEWGAEFDKKGTKLSFTLEAAHSKRRILHARGDATGKEIEKVLINKVKTFPSATKYPFAFSLDLVVENGKCYGAYVMQEGKVKAILARATILSTGGAGQLFARTTNPFVATGDGMAIAYRAGAVLANMEFMQFHPTALYSAYAPQFLLSEAMRGEGAILRNSNGDAFMKNYHKDADLAPRDVVARAIISEMVKTESPSVFLDLTHLDKEFVKKRFPAIYATCLTYDFDITGEHVPVSPAAHYMIGGIRTDTDTATSIPGLYAAGEVTCTGVHGANRLASNSLLEGLVFGARAGISALRSDGDAGEIEAILHAVSERKAKTRYSTIMQYDEIRSRLRNLMWDRVGIIRCEESLTDARMRLRKWDWILERTFMSRRELELQNMVLLANLVTDSALERTCSIGTHYRSDHKDREECDYTVQIQMEKGISREPVITSDRSIWR